MSHEDTKSTNGEDGRRLSHEDTKSTKHEEPKTESHVLRQAQLRDTKSTNGEGIRTEAGQREGHGSTKGTNVDFDPLSNRAIGSALKVHCELGPGFLESIYHAALLVQLRRDGMQVDTQKEVVIRYAGVEVGVHRLDLVVDGTLVVELKATDSFDGSHMAQVLSYLKATGLKVGLLLNFGRPRLGVKRVVR